MFGIGTSELIVICIVALLVLGPEKLPGLLKTVGKAMAEFKRLSTDVKSTIDSEMRRLEEDERKLELEERRRKLEARKKAAAAKAEAAAGFESPGAAPSHQSESDAKPSFEVDSPAHGKGGGAA